MIIASISCRKQAHTLCSASVEIMRHFLNHYSFKNIRCTSLVIQPSLLISYKLNAQRSFSVTEPLSSTDNPMTKSCKTDIIVSLKINAWLREIRYQQTCRYKLTSNRMEPFLSLSNALNKKCAYFVASENKPQLQGLKINKICLCT